MENDIRELIDGYREQATEEGWLADQWLKHIGDILDETYKKKDYHPNVIRQILYRYVPELNNGRFLFEPSRQQQIEYNKQLKHLRAIPRDKTQKSHKWKEWRHNHINASEAHRAMIGSNKSFILQKSKPFEHISDGGVATEHGVRFEPISAEIYQIKTGKRVYEFDSIEHPLYSFLAASPDGIDEEGIMLEIKNPLSRDIVGVPKPEYYIQTQLQMEVCGLNQCNFVECKVEEYACLDYYLDDTSREYKGIIMEYTDENGKRQRYYSPLNICGQALESWLSQIRSETSGYLDINEIYWFLSKYSCFEVFRDKVWFNEIRPMLQNTWWEVLKYRENGQWDTIEIKRRAPKPVEKSAEKPTVCMIGDDDDY